MQFLRQLQNYGQSVFAYENPEWQRAALALIPITELESRARQSIVENSSLAYSDAFFKQLTRWYKHEFFRWVNQPVCPHCSGATVAVQNAAPNVEEARFGAGIVEVYRCTSCSTIVRFPRYNHAMKLLETRQGRCGEWVQCFMLLCRSVKYEMRAIHDWTDHVWVEYYSAALQRWIHCDPCEDVIDRPDLYETGWGKKLNYCIAFSIDECVDVTKRYTNKYEEVKQRRTLIQEHVLQVTICMQNLKMWNMQSTQRRQELMRRTKIEQAQLQAGLLPNTQSNSQSSNVSMASGALAGRTTGSAEWRRQRGEIGDEQKTNEVIRQQQEAHAIKQTSQSATQSVNQPTNQTTSQPTQPAQATVSKPAMQPDDTLVPVNTQANKPSSSQSSSQTTDGKSQVKLLFQQYRDQLTKGCGNSSCQNAYCASNKQFVAPASSADLATLALKLTSKHKTDPQLH